MRTILLRQKTGENLFALAWREIALLRTFKIFTTLMLLLMPTDVIAQSNTTPPSSRPEGKPMSLVSSKRPAKRMPAQPIYVYQDGRTLMFDEEHMGDTVMLTDGDTVVFTGTVDSGCNVVIPEDIKGEVKVLLICGDKVYFTYLEF